jgi:nitrate reductase assembly molybdenum cofactor insertion protein NarJ
MMGPKKLSTIREELRQHLSRDGKDPIDWLQECLAERPKPEDSRVLEALLELLQEPPKKSKSEKSQPTKRRPARKR